MEQKSNQEECVPQETHKTDGQWGASQSIHQSILLSTPALQRPPLNRFYPKLPAVKSAKGGSNVQGVEYRPGVRRATLMKCE